MIFSGILYFDDESGDDIHVKRLILSGDDVAFNGVATWNQNERYEIDTRAHRAGEIFVSGETCPKTGTTTGYPVVLSFSKLEKIEDVLFIEGSWLVSGQAYAFSGELEPISL